MKKRTVLIVAVAVLAVALAVLVGIFAFGGGGGGNTDATQPAATEAPGTTIKLGTSVYQPKDMVGSWIMTAAGEETMLEVAEDRGTLEISGTTAVDMIASYTDNDTPEDCFYDKPLLPWVGEMYPGCGNAAWAADVDYTGEDDTTFVLTMKDDGTLLMQISFEMDGIAVVSYRTFARETT